LNLRPLGYEPYDARLWRLAWSLVAAVTSVNGRGASTSNLGVSRVALYPTAFRAQTRAQNLVADQSHRRTDDRFRVLLAVESPVLVQRDLGARQLARLLARVPGIASVGNPVWVLDRRC
jgi:hypothetical protein